MKPLPRQSQFSRPQNEGLRISTRPKLNTLILIQLFSMKSDLEKQAYTVDLEKQAVQCRGYHCLDIRSTVDLPHRQSKP